MPQPLFPQHGYFDGVTTWAPWRRVVAGTNSVHAHHYWLPVMKVVYLSPVRDSFILPLPPSSHPRHPLTQDTLSLKAIPTNHTMKSNMPAYQPLKRNRRSSPKPTLYYTSTKGSLLDDDVREVLTILLLLVALAFGIFWVMYYLLYSITIYNSRCPFRKS